jgi:hypothetical protein
MIARLSSHDSEILKITVKIAGGFEEDIVDVETLK